MENHIHVQIYHCWLHEGICLGVGWPMMKRRVITFTSINLVLYYDYIFLIQQCNEVRNSSAMEHEGLKRLVQLLQDSGLEIVQLITDRHVQNMAWIRDNLPDCIHYFDIWHVDKGI